jgi:acetamidase/formamidase
MAETRIAVSRLVAILMAAACAPADDEVKRPAPVPDFTIPAGREHFAFSRSIPPVLRVADGAIIEAHAKEASNNLVKPGMTSEEYRKLVWPDPYGHPLAGPVYVEGAEPGDKLAVTLLELELGDWGWTDTSPDFSYIGSEVGGTHLKTYVFDVNKKAARFSDRITVPLRPFPGVMGVAPDTDSMLSTVPPRANGGNMDDPNIVEGTTVYFPVFVKGALFSIGDPHAAQGHGEISGTAIEAPMRIVFKLNLIKGGHRMSEPQYETKDFYAATAFARTLDEAAKKATRYMVEWLMSAHGLERHEANMLGSIAGDLKIAEVVDGNVLVVMHMPKAVFMEK